MVTADSRSNRTSNKPFHLTVRLAPYGRSVRPQVNGSVSCTKEVQRMESQNKGWCSVAAVVLAVLLCASALRRNSRSSISRSTLRILFSPAIRE